MKHLISITILLLFQQAAAQEKSDDLAYQAFQQGQEAYARADYLGAVDHFEAACRQALIFTGAYYIWLGTACERAYDTMPPDPVPERLAVLKKGVGAYRIAFDREHDPDIRYELGRLMVKNALAHAAMVLDREVAGQPLPLQPLPEELADSAHSLQRVGFRASTVDSVNRFWGVAEDGLHEIWEAILGRERKEHTLMPQSPMSDTLQAYLSVYIENSLNLVESSGRVNFRGLEPDFYIPKIAAACERGFKGTNPDWFNQVLSAVSFDGGYNMRCGIYRLKGLRLSKDAHTDPAIGALKNALIYARSDTSRASLYLDMAFTAYRTDLVRAVEYARQAYTHNPYDARVRDTYGGLALSLASNQLKEGGYRRAISAIYPATTFGWQDRGEALITLAIAYVNSNLKGVSDRAYEAAEKAYRIDPDRYWKEFHRIARLQGNYIQALDLEQKHGNGKSNGHE